MSTGEIVDTSLRLYQRLGLTFLGVSAIPALLCLAAVAFVGNYVLPGLFYSQDGGNFLTHLGQVGIALTLALFIGGPLFLSGVAYTTCIIVSLVSDWFLGNPIDPAAAEEVARRAMPRLLVVVLRELLLAFSGVIASTALMMLGEWLQMVTPDTTAWAGIVALVGVLGLIFGVIIFLAVIARDGIVAPVAVLENLGPAKAGRRSRELLKPAPYHPSGISSMYGLYLLIAFFATVLLGGIYASAGILGLDDMVDRLTAGMFLRPLLLEAFDLAPIFVTIWTLLPVAATTVTILYFDRRVRLEGYDIEVLGRDLARNSRTNRLQL
jgi:hypothetical protein